MTRSNTPTVRNPILALPCAQTFQRLPADAKAAALEFLKEFEGDARARAAKSWRTNKGPMAAYWKAGAVYARHIRVAIRRAAT